MHTSSRAIACALLGALLAAGCSDGPSEPGPGGDEFPTLSLTLAPAGADAAVQRVFARVDRVNVAVYVGEDLAMNATLAATPTNGTIGWEWPIPPTLEGRAITLKVEARMGGEVLFTGDGSAMLQQGVVSASVPPLTVRTRIRIAPVTAIEWGDTVPVHGHLEYGTGDTVPGAQLSWGARNSNFSPPVLGLLSGSPPRAVGLREGSARLVATHEWAYNEMEVSVRSRVTSLTLAPDSVDARPGDVVQLGATARDRRGHELSRSYTWTSSDSTVALVETYRGVVTAVAPGRATISISQDGVTATAVVRVLPAAAARAAGSPP